MSDPTALKQLSSFTDALKEERRRKGLGRKADTKEWYESVYQKSLTFYADNTCNKGKGFGLRTGFNHVQIDLVYKRPSRGKPGEAYYVMEYSQNIPKREGVIPSKFKETKTAIQLPLDTFNPPQFENNKIKVTYIDKNGKECTVLLGPCNTPEKEQEYKCPVRGVDFVDDEDWKEKVILWFQTRFEIAKRFAILSGEWQGKEPTLEKAMAPLTDPKTVSENPKIIELSQQAAEMNEETDKTAQKAAEEAERHLEDAQNQLDEHHKAMEEHDKIEGQTLGETPKEEQKTGGKKRRTKRRKSNRRKKGKKSKKH